MNIMMKENFIYIDKKDVFWNSYRIVRKDREHLNKHRSVLLWFTGLSGSGKSILASILEEELHRRLVNTYVLDGDNIRHGLCDDLTFAACDRRENLRRVAEVAKIMIDAGLVVLAAFISPNYNDRQMVRNMFAVNDFIEIFVDTPLYICEKRDIKGLYKKARSGIIKNFTGVDDLYEIPKNPDIHLDGKKSIAVLIHQLLDVVVSKIFVKNVAKNK